MKNTLFISLILNIFLLGNFSLQAQNGCTVSTAHNYDPSAVNEDGSCETCHDGIKNGDEEQVDCGGSNPDCQECPLPFHLDVQGNAKVDGLMGIGTDNPKSELHIKGNDGILNLEGTDHCYMQLYPDGFDAGRKGYIGYGNADSDNLTIQNTSSGIRLDANGKIALDAAHDVFLDAGATIVFDAPLGIGIGTGLNDIMEDIQIGDRFTIHNGGTKFIGYNQYYNGFENKRILADEASSISFTSTGDILLNTASVGLRNSPVNPNNGIVLRNNGNVGIGKLSPNYKLEVDGSAGKPGSGSWTVTSDKRLKNSIKKFKYGYDLVEKVKPIFYHYNGKENLPTDQEYIGVIAQELKEIAPFMVGEFEGENGETYLSVDPGAFDYILINAVKEIKEEKDEEIKALKTEIEDLRKLVNSITQDKLNLNRENNTGLTQQIENTASLIFQNQPNPFTTETTITYLLPETTQKATIHITDLNGKILESYPINNIGKGSLIVNGNTFTAGIYMYSLELDGQLVASKKMVLAK